MSQVRQVVQVPIRRQDPRDPKGHLDPQASPGVMDPQETQESQLKANLCNQETQAHLEIPAHPDHPDRQDYPDKMDGQDLPDQKDPKDLVDPQDPTDNQDRKVHPAPQDHREREVFVPNIVHWTEEYFSKMEQGGKVGNIYLQTSGTLTLIILWTKYFA